MELTHQANLLFALTSCTSYPSSRGACHYMWCFLCPPPPCTLFAPPRAACAGAVRNAQWSWLNTCMFAHTQHRFLVLVNKTTLVVTGACAHGSVSRLISGCAHALLSMWVHAYCCDMQRTLGTDECHSTLQGRGLLKSHGPSETPIV